MTFASLESISGSSSDLVKELNSSFGDCIDIICLRLEGVPKTNPNAPYDDKCLKDDLQGLVHAFIKQAKRIELFFVQHLTDMNQENATAVQKEISQLNKELQEKQALILQYREWIDRWEATMGQLLLDNKKEKAEEEAST